MMRFRWLQQACALGAGVLLALPAPAADGVNPDDAALRSFREGRALLREGRVAEGCKKLRASLELKRSPGVLLNVAGCARDQGDLLAAVAGFEAVRAEARTYPGDSERRRLWIDAAEGALRELQPRLAEIEWVVPSGAPLPSSWHVSVDGVPLTLSTGRARLNPGAHHLEVAAEGRAPYLRDVQLAEGERLRVEVQLELLAPTPTPTPMPVMPAGAPSPSLTLPLTPEPSEPPSQVLPVALTLGGGALAIAGLTVGLVTWQRKNELEPRCPGPSCPYDQVDSAERLATAADVLVISGAVLGAVGGAWLLWGQASEPATELQATCSGRSRCRASLTLSF
jgi:hypothetical protein